MYYGTFAVDLTIGNNTYSTDSTWHLIPEKKPVVVPPAVGADGYTVTYAVRPVNNTFVVINTVKAPATPDQTLPQTGQLWWPVPLLAIAGVVLVVLNGSLNFHLSPVGDLLALAAGISWAVYSILIKKYTETMDGFLVTRRVMFWAFLTSIPLMFLTDGMPNLTPLFTEPKVLLSWLFLGILGNAVCFAIWNIAFRELGVVVTNNYLYGSPFVTLIVGFLLLHEPISWMGVVGAVLITAGVILAQRDKRSA
jgi:drug/metabolite transporter (DMT)-like permease